MNNGYEFESMVADTSKHIGMQGIIGDAANAVEYMPDSVLVEFSEMGFTAQDFYTIDESAASRFRKVNETNNLIIIGFANCVQDNTCVSTCTQAKNRTVRSCLHSRAHCSGIL